MSESLLRDDKMVFDTIVDFFVNTQKAESMEEAYAKGYLMAAGGELARPSVMWALIKENPETWLPIERGIQEICAKSCNEHILVVVDYLTELYEHEDRAIPPWLNTTREQIQEKMQMSRKVENRLRRMKVLAQTTHKDRMELATRIEAKTGKYHDDGVDKLTDEEIMELLEGINVTGTPPTG